ncbi:MAG: glucuronate isomerase [Bacteroidota bacterium]
MKKFLDKDFLLQSDTASRLYHDYASPLPIIDYHCHLDPKLIAEDHNFDNLTEAWLAGDHYKWRAMRANGVDEKYITGSAGSKEKFMKWAETVPDTLRNPLYHWTHLELQRYFGIEELLNKESAGQIYEEASEMLRSPEYSIRKLIRKMNVEVICTTDDPADSLEHHQKIREDGFETLVLPAWRPDRAMMVEDAAAYNQYLERLEAASDSSITNFNGLLDALQKRHDYFHTMGSRISDHGIEGFYAEPFSEAEIESIFRKVRSGGNLTGSEINSFKSAMLYHFAVMDQSKGWVQQFHVGAIRNNNPRMFTKLGADTGYDSISDLQMARSISQFLGRLESEKRLTKTIMYNLNPADNAMLATMLNNFNDGTIAGKMQFGSGWWFLDQKQGMTDQLNTLSSLGLLSRFVGMLTDSRSFLSFPRHEYFRRILCNLVGTDVENGEIPNEPDLLKPLIENVCYYNAKRYFELG